MFKPLLLTLIFSAPLYCRAVEDIQTGPNGTPGAPGSAGGSATATAVSSDPSNAATATGGNGGSSTSDPQGDGGNASATAQTAGTPSGSAVSAAATAVGGNAGVFTPGSTAVGDGGDASAIASASGDGPTLTVTANATGGNAGGVFTTSVNAPGGLPGSAYASATGNLASTGMLVVTATATGGNGGNGAGSGNGADGDSPTFGPVFGSSLGDATISAVGYGGRAGYGQYSGTGAPGAAGSVVLNNVVSGSASGHLTLSQAAFGGQGGSGLNYQSAGGDATSILQVTATTPTAILELRSSSRGGFGGERLTNDGMVQVIIGAAGSATAHTNAVNLFGTALASSSAESGISLYSVLDGSTLGVSAAVAVATAQGLGATAEAMSLGEDGAVGLIAPLHGGSASSTASATSLSTLPAVSVAQASNRYDSISDPGFRPNGGTSLASASSVGLGEVSATASATGGSGRRESRAGDALAMATATGASGSANVNANTSQLPLVPGRLRGEVDTYGTASVAGTSTGQAQARFAAPITSSGGLLSRQVTSDVVAQPLGGDVTAALAGNGAASAVFNASSAAQNLVLANLGGGRGSTVSLAFTLQFDLANYAPSEVGRLQLALLNPQSSGAGFDSLRLQVLGFGPSIDVTFDTLADAQTYFSDHVLAFGAIDRLGFNYISVRLDIVTSRTEDAFGATFLVGNVVVPEPATWLILAAGGCVVAMAWRRRREA